MKPYSHRLFYKSNSTKLTSKFEFEHDKDIKIKIKAHGSIVKEGSGRPDKYQRFIKNYILKLIAYSPFNTSYRIALKLKNNYEVEVH